MHDIIKIFAELREVSSFRWIMLIINLIQFIVFQFMMKRIFPTPKRRRYSGNRREVRIR